MSDTPETDVAIVESYQYYQSLYPSFKGRNQAVHADFARKLERERDKLRKDVHDLNEILRRAGWGQGEINSCWSIVEEAEAERDAWRKMADELAEITVLKAILAGGLKGKEKTVLEKYNQLKNQ